MEGLGAVAFNDGETEKAAKHFKQALATLSKCEENKVAKERILTKLSDALGSDANSELSAPPYAAGVKHHDSVLFLVSRSRDLFHSPCSFQIVSAAQCTTSDQPCARSPQRSTPAAVQTGAAADSVHEVSIRCGNANFILQNLCQMLAEAEHVGICRIAMHHRIL